MNKKILIKKSDFPGIVVFLVVFNLLFVSNLDSTVYFLMRNLSTLIATAFTILNIKEIKNNTLLWFVAGYSLIILISTHINGEITIQALIYAVNIFNLFIASDICKKHNKIGVAISLIKIYILFLCLTNDFFLFVSKSTQWPEKYFLGNKFFVCYYHLILLCLLLASKNRKRDYLWVTIGGALLLYLSIITDCMSMAVGSVTFVVIYLIISRKKIVESNGLLVIIAVILTLLFAVFPEFIINTNVIQSFFKNVLNRSDTVFSRIRIYSLVIVAIQNKLFFGYGYDNRMYSMLTDAYHRVPNSQNGLLDVISYYGLIGAAFFVLILYISINGKKITKINRAIFSAIGVFIFLGTIEITFSHQLLILLALFSAFQEDNFLSQNRLSK